jgi:hypothetical protein
MKVPGFLWTAVLALIPLLIQWLEGDYFTGQTWVSIAVLVLGFAAKAIELYLAQKRAVGYESFGGAPESRVKRFLVG